MRRLIGLTGIVLAIAACANAKSSHDASPPTIDAAVEATPAGTPGRQIVPGAIKARSTNFKMVGTITAGDNSGASPSYTQRGGVVGATQP